MPVSRLYQDLPDLRRLQYATVLIVRRLQEVNSPQQLYQRVCCPQVHELRRSRISQMLHLLLLVVMFTLKLDLRLRGVGFRDTLYDSTNYDQLTTRTEQLWQQELSPLVTPCF